MKNIVVFGKPKTFESYEFEFEERLATKNTNTHIEPYIKPIRQNEKILHYFKRDDFVCYEYYGLAKGFDSSRTGSVFGIGIKSDKDINLFASQTTVLLPYFKEFSNSFLQNDNSFIAQSIIDNLSKTVWSEKEQETIVDSISNESPPKTTKELLLLVVPDFSLMATLVTKIKEYSDVYISDNSDIFNDPINLLLLKKSNGQIFTVKNDNIVLFRKPKENDDADIRKGFNNSNNKNGSEKTEKSSNKKGFEKIEDETRRERERIGEKMERKGFDKAIINKDEQIETYSEDSGPSKPFGRPWWKTNSKALIIIAGILIISLIVFVTKKTNNGKGETKKEQNPLPGRDTTTDGNEANSIRLASYSNPIKQSLNISPVPLYNDSENTKTKSNEIKLELSGEGAQYVSIVGTELKVNSKPPKNTEVTVIAKLNKKELGRVTYTLAAVDNHENIDNTPAYSNVIISFEEGINENTSFSIKDKIVVTALSNGQVCKGGKWMFGNGLSSKRNDINPITITCIKEGPYILSYNYKSTSKENKTKRVTINVDKN